MTMKTPTIQQPRPLSTSPSSNQDEEIQKPLNDSRYRNIQPPSQAMRQTKMPITMQNFEFPKMSNHAPRSLPTIDTTGHTEAKPYRTEKGFLNLNNGDNDVQDKRSSRRRSSMQTFQTRGRPQGYRRRRPGRKWMKWMNSESKNHIVAMIGELIGTTLFLFFGYAGIEVSKLQSPVGQDLQVLFYISATFGTSLMVTAWIFYRISGGLFNPAVTLALALLQAVTPVRAFLLVITQLGSSCLAVILVNVIFPKQQDFATALGSNTSIAQGLCIEAITTAALIFTIIMLAVEKHKATFLAPVAIGLTLFVAHMVAVPFTGASLNPARSFGPSAVAGIFPREHWIYWLGPILGAGLAVLLFRLIKVLEYEMANPGQDGDPENDPTQNPEHDIAQNVLEREEEVNEVSNLEREEELDEVSPVKSWHRKKSSLGSIRREKSARRSASSATGSRGPMDQRGSTFSKKDDIEAQ
ncbi:hypothetical protein DSL72_004338 [Monilinia vaccinii-corymbosi]|uniref:Aquaporin n=1 Tax=Monilinia vaccinii-corymbosi TaxID=61207 RepID=A0A8A3P085_9HELO|nr:hypothetical protein DSL72_004338 [Monilinia vaccinii-corymbosi]